MCSGGAHNFRGRIIIASEGKMYKAKDKKWFVALVNIEQIFTQLITGLCAIWFFAMIACMVWQVVSRFILHLSVPWTDEASRYLWITLAFIGAGAAISDNSHVEINIIASILKGIDDKRKKHMLARISDIFRYSVMIALGVFLAFQFILFTHKVVALGQLSAALMIPMCVPYIIIDIGIVSIIVHSLFRLIISVVDHDSIIDPQVIGGER